MKKITRLILIALALILSLIIFTSPSKVPIPKPIIAEMPALEIITTNLDNPRSMAFSDTKIYIAEKNGNIKTIQTDTFVEKTLTSINVYDTFNGGLLGLATHPNFIKNHYVYAYYTYDNNGVLWNKVIRITDHDDEYVDEMTILDKIPGSKFNNGGVIKFGPDYKLYISTGILSNSSKFPQDLNSLEGKILRLNYDGTIPSDNPFSNSAIFSYGHRNPQGMSWDYQGNFFVSELGDMNNDEINLIKAGQNYGWPIQECLNNDNNDHFVVPLMCYDPGIEPGGILTYNTDVGPNLIISSLRNGSLYNLKIDQNKLHSQQTMLSGIGRIRDIGIGHDDYIYMITSNTDGKGFPSRHDDKLIRFKK